MRFRTDIEQVSTLYRQPLSAHLVVNDAGFTHEAVISGISQTVQALTKTCIIKWSPDLMQIIVPGGENDGGVQVWSYVVYATQNPSPNSLTVPFV
jgi:hypothetical protein